MQYFYVKQNLLLKLPHKQKQLIAPTQQQLSENKIPLDRIYCGFIAWEHIQAKQQIGEADAILVATSDVPESVLPYKITTYNEGGSLVNQLHKCQPTNGELRIAIINGTGTMLGDTIIGSSVVESLLSIMKAQGLNISFDVFCAWNARPGVESIWERNSAVNTVFGSAPTISDLQKYDAYIDFTSLLHMQGYGTEHYADFYYNSFGVDPITVSVSHKLPIIRTSEEAFKSTQNRINEFTKGKGFVFVQAEASTPGRSLPNEATLLLLQKLCASGTKVVLSGTLPEALGQEIQSQILNLQEWTRNNLDRYVSAIALAQRVISVDTLALHVAMGCKKPGIGLFSLTHPSRLLKYSPQIVGYLIKDAERLSYWNKFKSDDKWASEENSYKAAWIDLLKGLQL